MLLILKSCKLAEYCIGKREAVILFTSNVLHILITKDAQLLCPWVLLA